MFVNNISKFPRNINLRPYETLDAKDEARTRTHQCTLDIPIKPYLEAVSSPASGYYKDVRVTALYLRWRWNDSNSPPAFWTASEFLRLFAIEPYFVAEPSQVRFILSSHTSCLITYPIGPYCITLHSCQ